MIPFYIFSSLESFFDFNQLNYRLTTKEDLISFVEKINQQPSSPLNKLDLFVEFIEDGKSKTDCVYEQSNSEKFSTYFPRIQQYAPWLIRELLFQTNNPIISKITAYFQNLILGDILFEEIILSVAKVKTDSYLSLFDKKNLDEYSRTRILDLIRQKRIYCSAITARPTGISLDNGNDDYYFPEGELGLKTVGLDQMPVIGFGTVTYLATLMGKTGEYYLKPSPIHALAAILAAVGYSDIDSVMFAHQMMSEPTDPKNKERLDELFYGETEISIFEDSTGGIRSVNQLSNWLNQMGYPVIVHLYGITQDEYKAKALIKENAAIYEDINAALKKGLGKMEN